MTTMLLAIAVQTAILAAGVDATPVSAETYAQARQTVTETGKPMVVMVGTDWCPPCQTMKKTVLPRVRERGLLRKVVFAVVNPDRERKLAEELTGGGPIPQLLMFRKKGDGWVRQKLVGGQSVETVEQFIEEGLAKDKADKKSSDESADAPAPRDDQTTSRADGADESATRRG